MATPLGMDSYAARLSSFETAHTNSKRRTLQTKGAKLSAWPHEAPTTSQLARAGFYYSPTASSLDNVTCFQCHKVLDGWEEDDDPIREHLNFSPSCGWAIVQAIEQCIEDGTPIEDDPNSTKMIEARKATFRNMWPHDGKRGWTCKTQKMAEAGWYYCSTAESDDYVKCAYCSLSLDGWEPKDKPYDEHKRRSPECIVFTFSQDQESKTAKSRKGRVSKASRFSELPSAAPVIEDQSSIAVDALDDDSVLTVETDGTLSQNAAPKAMKKGKKAKKAPPKAKSKPAKTKKEDVDIASSVIEPEDDDFEVKVNIKPTENLKSKKRGSEQMETAIQEDVNLPTAKRRATGARNSTARPQPETMALAAQETDLDLHMTDVEDAESQAEVRSKKGVRSGRKRGSSVVRKASTMSTASKASLRAAIVADEEIEAALEIDLDRPLTDDEEADMPEEVLPKTRQSTKTRPASRKTTASSAPMRRTTRASTVQPESLEDHIGHAIGNENINNLIEAFPEPELLIEEQLPSVIKTSKVPKAKTVRKASKASNIAKHSKTKNTALFTDDESMENAIAVENIDLGLEVIPAMHTQELSHEVRQVEVAETREVQSRPASRLANSRSSKAVSSTASQVSYTTNIDLDSSVITLHTIEDDAQKDVDDSRAKDHAKKRNTRKASAAPKITTTTVKSVTQAQKSNIDEDPSSAADIKGSLAKDDNPETANPMAADADVPIDQAEPGKKKPKALKPKAAKAKTNKKGTVQQVINDIVSGPVSIEVEDNRSVSDSAPQAPTLPSTPKYGVPSPTPSPQSSDAENHPPSSRPSQTRPPLAQLSPLQSRTMRVPLAANTPTGSPSRLNVPRLQTGFPWSAVDMDAIFLASPDKENASATLTRLGDGLSSPEKKMTVEEWIHFNARTGEEKLRNECERIVGRFESEGVRALKALEGIICVE